MIKKIEKSTLKAWEVIGGSGTIAKYFDKMAKSFVVQMSERDARLRYPKQEQHMFQ